MTLDSYAVDTSALAAIVFAEDDAWRYADVLARYRGSAVISAPTLLECRIVIEGRQGPAGGALLSEILERAAIEVVPMDADAERLAMSAWRRFGKGRHPAALNYGDCIAYATAKERGIPLLYKGRDFAQTDISSVL